MKGQRFLLHLHNYKVACQFHGCWWKTQTPWVRDKGRFITLAVTVASVFSFLDQFPKSPFAQRDKRAQDGTALTVNCVIGEDLGVQGT